MTDKSFHLMVWIDRRIARIYAISRDGIRETATIHAHELGHGNVRHGAGTQGSGHGDVSPDFLGKTCAALSNAQEILIVGPADAKHALKRHLAQQEPRLDKRVLGVEPMDKADNGALHAFASLFFHQADRMKSRQEC